MSPVRAWPRYPVVYEINTWVWLRELRHAAGHPVTLDTVPSRAWDALAALGVDAVWLMGVWERSPEGRRIALANPSNLADFQSALPGFSEADALQRFGNRGVAGFLQKPYTAPVLARTIKQALKTPVVSASRPT